MLRLYDENNRDIMNELSSSDCCSNPSCLREPWCCSINGRSAAAVVGEGGRPRRGNDGDLSLADTSSQV